MRVIEKRPESDNVARECLSAAKTALRKKKKVTQEDTGITFVTLSEAVAAIEETFIDQK